MRMGLGLGTSWSGRWLYRKRREPSKYDLSNAEYEDDVDKKYQSIRSKASKEMWGSGLGGWNTSCLAVGAVIKYGGSTGNVLFL